MGQPFSEIVLLVVILGVSALVTSLFARWMYIVCPSCGALNARRGAQCRSCGKDLRARPVQ